MDEYRKAKSSIKEGKAWGDNNIAPEVLKQCDLDQIVLKFCNIMLYSKARNQTNGQLPTLYQFQRRATLANQ